MKTTIITLALVATTGLANADQWKVFNTSNSEIQSNVISSVYVQDHSVWTGNEHGIFVQSDCGERIDTISDSNFPNVEVNGFITHPNGETWVATNEGISRYSDHGWEYLNTDNSGLPFNIINTMLVDKDNSVWIGTWGGGLAKMSHQWDIFNTENSDLASNGITSLAQDCEGRIWVGTFNQGISIYDGTSWIKLNTGNSLLNSNDISGIYADGNVMWIGTSQGIARYENGQITTFTNANTGLVFNRVNCFIREGNYLWIGTDGGILRYDGSGFINYRTANSGLPHNSVVSIGVDSFGNKWVGTAGGGLVEFNSEGIVQGLGSAALGVDVNVYPNPVTERVFVTNNESESLQVEIYALTGNLVASHFVKAGEKAEIDMQHFPKSVYTVALIGSKKTKTLRLVKE